MSTSNFFKIEETILLTMQQVRVSKLETKTKSSRQGPISEIGR